MCYALMYGSSFAHITFKIIKTFQKSLFDFLNSHMFTTCIQSCLVYFWNALIVSPACSFKGVKPATIGFLLTYILFYIYSSSKFNKNCHHLLK